MLISLAWLWAFFGARPEKTLNHGEVASLMGATTHACFFLRVLCSFFSDTYRWLDRFFCKFVPDSILSEIVGVAILLPLAECNTAMDFDSRIWSSDASSFGGAFGCASRSRNAGVPPAACRHDRYGGSCTFF